MTSAAALSKHARLAALRSQLGGLECVRTPARPGVSLRPVVPDLIPGTLNEVVPDAYLDTPSAFAFLVALAVRAVSARPGPVLLSICERGFDFGLPNPSALAAAGIPPRRITLVRAPDAKGALWALEEGARTRGVALSIAAALPDAAYGLLPSRRLTLAIERTGVPVLIMRMHGSRWPTAARMRWRVAGVAGNAASYLGAHGLPGIGARRWRVSQDRALGAPQSFEVEWNETALRFDPPAALVRGPGAAERAGVLAIRAA